MKLVALLVGIFASFSAFAEGQEYKTWAEKYKPTDPLSYSCTVSDWVGNVIPFVITFKGADYSGSNGGYFYTNITRTGMADGFEGPQTEFKLFSTSAFVQGAYTFEDHFEVKLTGELPLDGNIDNNLYLSKRLKAEIYRGDGNCLRLDR